MDPSSSPALLIAFGLGYILGSIPFGLLLTRLAGLGDVRQIGSGNIGATNVLRTGRKGLAATTLVLDAAKAAAAVLIARHCLGELPAMIAGFGALLGHIFRFGCGSKAAKASPLFSECCWRSRGRSAAVFAALWIAVAALSRISSLAAIVATVAAPIAAWAFGLGEFAIVLTLMAAIILFKHRGNIRRLLAGEEPRIGAKA